MILLDFIQDSFTKWFLQKSKTQSAYKYVSRPRIAGNGKRTIYQMQKCVKVRVEKCNSVAW
jgi:hypothetical protein